MAMHTSTLKSLLVFILMVLGPKDLSSQTDTCNYFGLEQPGLTPLDFNPKVLDLNGSFKFNVTFSNCNELYFTTITSSENIFVTKKEDGQWSSPRIASFSDPNYNDADPFLNADGSRIYFISKRPTHEGDDRLDFNIWYADRTETDWTQPQPLPKPINSDEFDEYMFSVSNEGNAFFSSNRAGGNGSFDIYTAQLLNDNRFSEPKNLGGPISTEAYEFDPYISPDEEFMLFSINQNGNSSLFFSLKKQNGDWSEPQNLGNRINVSNQDFAPSISSDGQFIFFSNNGKLRWVSSKVLLEK